MRYRTLLWDLDHTLLDSEASEALAFELALRTAGVDNPEVHFSSYVQINRELWAGVERGEITPVEVSIVRFERLVLQSGVDADPHILAEAFVEGLGACGDLFPEAHAVLRKLSLDCRQALITNGLTAVQHNRVERLELRPFFDTIVISSEVGVAKPAPGIFAATFARLGWPDLETALMIGDSLTSDIQGGNDFGIDTCWYNPRGHVDRDSAPATHEIAALRDLIPIVHAGPDN